MCSSDLSMSVNVNVSQCHCSFTDNLLASILIFNKLRQVWLDMSCVTAQSRHAAVQSHVGG